MKTIKILVKSVFGREMIYPANEIAGLFCKLLKQESLTRTNLKLIKELGYEVEQVKEIIDI